jgi:molecular chaperone GrpE
VENNDFEPEVSEAGEELPVETPEARVAALTGECDQLAKEKAELNDSLLRLRAEFENFRRREERTRSEFLQYSSMELVKDLLPILDDFERAMRAETADASYAKGIELIYNRFYETLRKMGLEPIEAQGKPFDPNLHQAVDRLETGDAEDHTVLQEYQRGYNFKGKLLRPSMVKVAVKP